MKIFRTMRVTCCLFIFMTLFVGEAWCATWSITSEADVVSSPAAGTLRHALLNAADGDTIVLTPLVGWVRTVAELPINKSVTIRGESQVIWPLNPGYRAFSIASGKQVSMEYIFIAGADLTSTGEGGAVLNRGTLNMTHCYVYVNDAKYGAALVNYGTASITDSNIDSNTATEKGGGIFNQGTLNLTRTSMQYNKSNQKGGAIMNEGPMTLTQCSITNNTAVTFGGGIYSTASHNNVWLKTNTVIKNNSPDQILASYSTDGTCTIGSSPASSPYSIHGAAEGQDPKPRKIIGEKDIVILEQELETAGSAILSDVSAMLSSDLGSAPATVEPMLYDAFTYENVNLSDDSGGGNLEIEFTASWPENVRYYAAFAKADNSGYVIPERGVQFEIKSGQSLPDGVTPPDFYIPGEGLMTWRNAISDNGSFDLDPAVGKVTFRVASIRAENSEPSNRASGAGCGATGSPTGFVLLLIPLFAFIRRTR